MGLHVISYGVNQKEKQQVKIPSGNKDEEGERSVRCPRSQGVLFPVGDSDPMNQSY